MRFIIMLLILCGCSASHHYNKAIKKGLKLEPTNKIITVTDTLTINGKDSIIERLITVDCPEPIIQTKWRVRFDNKRFKDSLKIFRRMYSDSLRYALKTSKTKQKENKANNKTKRTQLRQENKRNLWWLWLIIGFVLSFVTKIFLKNLTIF